MQAEIAIRIKRALMLENADLVLADLHDLPIAIVERICLSDEMLRHAPLSFFAGRRAFPKRMQANAPPE
jgi:hypothetical protein